MGNNLKQDKINKLNSTIDSLNIEPDAKYFLYRIEKGIMESPNGRVYINNSADYQEYICFKIPNNKENNSIQFCISKRFFDEASSTKLSQNEFPTYQELIEYITANKEQIESSLKSIEYYVSEKKEIPQTPSIINTIRRKIELAPTPEIKKARAFAVLDALASQEKQRIYAVKSAQYEEYISLINGYLTVTEKMLDYSGATQGRNVYILKSNKLIDYVQEHQFAIDESLSKPKRL